MSTRSRAQVICTFLVILSMAAAAQTVQVMAYVNSKPGKEMVSHHAGDEYHYVPSLDCALPSFRGGESALIKYFDENLNYPNLALEYGVEGETFVEFTIDLSGKPINPQVHGEVGFGCDQEVKRIINSMPKWNPGIKDGRAVSSTVQLAINFRLSL